MWRLAEGGALRVVPSASYPPTLPGYHPQVGRSWKEEGFELLALQHGQSAVWAAPQLGSYASSGRAWRLWAARYSRGEAQPLGTPPFPH